MHQPSFLEFLKAQYLRNFLIHLLKKGVYIYLPNGGKLQYKECGQMQALTEVWRKHK